MLTYYIYVFCLQPLITDLDLTWLFFVLLAKLLVALLSVLYNIHEASTRLGYGMSPKVPHVKSLINNLLLEGSETFNMGTCF